MLFKNTLTKRQKLKYNGGNFGFPSTFPYLPGKIQYELNFDLESSASVRNANIFIFSLQGLRQHTGQHNVDYLREKTEEQNAFRNVCDTYLLARRAHEHRNFLR
jgi:hypothetical protein